MNPSTPNFLDQVTKEGNEMKMKKMDIHVKWGGVNLDKESGEHKIVYFKEGEDYQTIGKFQSQHWHGNRHDSTLYNDCSLNHTSRLS